MCVCVCVCVCLHAYTYLLITRSPFLPNFKYTIQIVSYNHVSTLESRTDSFHNWHLVPLDPLPISLSHPQVLLLYFHELDIFRFHTKVRPCSICICVSSSSLFYLATIFSQFIYVVTNARIFLFFWPCFMACGISVPPPEIKSVPLAAEAQTLNEESPRIFLIF